MEPPSIVLTGPAPEGADVVGFVAATVEFFFSGHGQAYVTAFEGAVLDTRTKLAQRASAQGTNMVVNVRMLAEERSGSYGRITLYGDAVRT